VIPATPTDGGANTGTPGNGLTSGDGSLTPGEALRRIKDAGVPTVTIGNQEVPLFGLGDIPVWALLNLILMVGGMILAIAVPIVVAVRQNDYKDEERNRARREVNGRYGRDDRDDRYDRYDRDEPRGIHRPLMMILTIILGIVGVIAFILTENMNNLMVILDRWTLLMIVLFAAGALTTVFTFRRRQEDEEEYAGHDGYAGQDTEYRGRHRRS
jgi:hypothetical protein